jgi:curved DNA-binding protein CbpA
VSPSPPKRLPVDPYATLGVPPSATVADIRKAYRRRARETHPDLNPGLGSSAAFRAVKEAYSMLREGWRQPRADSPGASDAELHLRDAMRRVVGGFRARCEAMRASSMRGVISE